MASVTEPRARTRRADIDELLGESERLRAVYDAQEDVMEAAALIRAMRAEAGLSQEQVAERAGTTQAHVSALERGVGRQGPTVELLSRIGRACNAPITIVRQAEIEALHSRIAELEDGRKQVAMRRSRRKNLLRVPNGRVVQSG